MFQTLWPRNRKSVCALSNSTRLVVITNWETTKRHHHWPIDVNARAHMLIKCLAHDRAHRENYERWFHNVWCAFAHGQIIATITNGIYMRWAQYDMSMVSNPAQIQSTCARHITHIHPTLWPFYPHRVVAAAYTMRFRIRNTRLEWERPHHQSSPLDGSIRIIMKWSSSGYGLLFAWRIRRASFSPQFTIGSAPPHDMVLSRRSLGLCGAAGNIEN